MKKKTERFTVTTLFLKQLQVVSFLKEGRRWHEPRPPPHLFLLEGREAQRETCVGEAQEEDFSEIEPQAKCGFMR